MKNSMLHRRLGCFAALAATLVFFCTPAVRAADVVGAVATGGDRVEQLAGSHDIVHTFTRSGTFTLSEPATVRYLVVGGGGAGGATTGEGGNSAGGGGAGGFLPGTTNLAAGTYTITVGAGGATLGADGSPSSIAGGAFEITAFGGGGGGKGGEVGRPGGSGGGGGATTSGRKAGGAGVSGQGNAGGDGGAGPGGKGSLDTVGGGGGGAGAPGETSNIDGTNHDNVNSATAGWHNKRYHAGNGGAGLPSDITGEEVWYAGGGGGSTYRAGFYMCFGGEGGKGGGGHGSTHDGPQSTLDGAPGTGGGGGGQSRPTWRNGVVTDRRWGQGGSGIVILRYAAAGDAVGLEADEPKTDATNATVRAWAIGAAEVEGVRWGTDPASLGNAAAAGAAAGEWKLAPLVPGTTYYAQAFDGAIESPVASFTVPKSPLNELQAFPIELAMNGDYTARFRENATFTLPAPARVRVAAVAGGGGGGFNAGAGGGAGGMLETNLLLEAGTYAVTIGAGGAAAPNTNTHGSKGGDTVLAKVDGDATNALVRAFGGGGGASWTAATDANQPLLCGGSGGGTTRRGTPGYAVDAAQGHGGGPFGSEVEDTSEGGPSGGGGAGGPGDFIDRISPYKAGAGGPGRGTDLVSTGEIFACGGGGGSRASSSMAAAAGGREGSGHGVRLGATAKTGDEDGLPNTGDGGGGGDGAGTIAGGAGGSGILLLSFVPPAEMPVFGEVSVEEGIGCLHVTVIPRTDGMTVVYRAVADGGDLDAATPVLVTSSATADVPVTFTIAGPAAETLFHVRLESTNGGYSAFPVETSGIAWGADPALAASVAANDARTRTGADEVHTLASSGTFTLDASRLVRFLAVGGGGGAGWGSSGGGAGGGAGGMLEGSNVLFRPGTYRYEVGAGGAPGLNDESRGGNGGDTVLWYVDPVSGTTTEVARAIGGGGSGAWADWQYRPGLPGGSGGGAVFRELNSNRWGAGGSGTPGQGHDGGGWMVAPAGAVGSCGGGGAGAPGQAGTAEGGGDGGDGRTCDITGAEVWYAGGGGASRRNDNVRTRVGKGGRGGGGNGTDVGEWTDRPSHDGVDGLGGGGGGGLAWEWRNQQYVNCFGGRGGSGTLILRFLAAPQAAPAFVSAAAGLKDRTVAAFSGTVEHTGDGAATADLVLTLDGVSETVATGLADGDAFSVERTVAGGASVAWSLTLVNGLGAESAPVAGTLAVPADAPVAIAATGASRVFDVGTDTVAVFTNTASVGSLVVPAGGAWVEILLVGGGGAGGYAWNDIPASGGGAGGFVHETARFLEAGTYAVTVGAGGPGREHGVKSGAFVAGNAGGPSILSLGGTEILKAHGGGAGAGSYASVNGTDGASSAGAMPRETQSYGWLDVPGLEPCVPGQGHRGGAGFAATITNASGSAVRLFPGGGGGAGAPGGDGDPAAQTFGAGGDGLPCSITGEEVWYAGGGGCGAAYRAPGSRWAPATAGGKGGGGHGQRWKAEIDPDNRGVDGLGGGGGSGGNASGNNDNVAAAGPGHSGGCGTVIVRWRRLAAGTIAVVPDEPVRGFRRGTFSGTVECAGGAGATLTLEIGLVALGSTETNWTTIATGLADGDAYAGVVDGLLDNKTYYATWRATGPGGTTAVGSAGSFKTLAGAYLVPNTGLSEGAAVTQLGNELVYTYTNSADQGTFVVSRPGYARVLVVGGGGAGGHRIGGGGGGGGVIEEELVWFDAGTYSIDVGAGGEPSTSDAAPGGNGGDSVLAKYGETQNVELWRAYGGGGGGSWTDQSAGLGSSGGSGGGSSFRRTTPGRAIDPAQGNDGAPARRYSYNNDNQWSPGGGGGAGSPGIPASSDHTVPGAGGAGRVSDISGSSEQYGAGGGAGGTEVDRSLAGPGGDGIGGHARRQNEEYWTGDEAGRAGFGGGGGSGARNGTGDWDNQAFNRRPGAPGGSGTVVIRFAASAPSGKADAAVVAAAPSATDPTAAALQILVRSLGNASSATLELAYGASRDALPLRHAVGTVTAAGTIDATLPGLEPGRTYYVAAAIRTAAGETVTRAMEVTIPATGALDGDGSYGLWQAPWGASATDRAPDIWDSIVTKSIVSGAIAAIGKGDATDPLTGAAWPWAYSPYMFLYRGYAFLKGGTTYTFGSRMDDSLYLAIGGTALIDTQDDPAHSVIADFTAPWTGWYPIDVRIGNATGGANDRGPDGDGVDSWTSFALAYNTDGNRVMIPESAWSLLLDPGDGSFLRPEDPGLRYADLDKYVEAQNATITASVAPGDVPVHAYLCSGPAWGGNDPAAWAVHADLGTVPAANAATALDPATVAGWGSDALVAAVALVHPDGTVTWSDPVTYAGTSLLSLSAAASDWSQGDELEVSFTVAGGTAPYRAELWIGNGPANLQRAATATGLAAGTHTLRATGLTPGQKYYWQVVVTDAAGSRAASDDSANVTMPAGAVYLDSSTGIWWSISQRTATLGGGLKALGAGDNWGLVRLYEDPYLVWENTVNFRGSATNSGDRVFLAETGRFSVTRDFPWESQIGFAWIVSNSNTRQTWTTSLMPSWNGNDAANLGTFWVGDNQTYTWTGGSGDWNDAGMWEPDGTKDGLDQVGFPISGSYASFPAGEHVVNVPAGGTKVENGVPVFRPTTLKLQADAKVTIQGTPESARFDLKHIYPPSRQGNISIPAGAQLVVSGVKGTWNPQRENGSSIYFSGTNALFEVTDGSEISIGGNGVGQWTIHSWDGSRDGRRIVFSKGSKTTVRGEMLLAGRQELVVDDAMVVMEEDSRSWEYSRIHFGFVSPGRFVLRGAHPLVVANNSVSVDAGTNPSSDAEQFIDFEIPAGGFAEAPLRCRKGNTTYLLGRDAGSTASSTANRKMILRVPADSPAATVKGVLEQPLVWWPAGKTDATILSPAYLPHPDTDSWYETFDTITGVFTGWGVRIVGRPDVEEPQVVGLAMTNLVSGSADFEFYGIPGTNAASATFSVSIARTDDPSDTSASAVLCAGLQSGASVTVAHGMRFSIAATGLVDGASYRLTITGTDDDDATLTCTETFDFDALRDYAEASTASAGATMAQDGPDTVWTFTDTENEGSFTVTRPGVARILVVGGGGSGGGGDSNDSNTSNSRRGGGGGGGGEVVETELYLQPGRYRVVVGAGGESVGVSAAGKTGGTSSFDARVVAYGGGGGGGHWWDGSKARREGCAGANGGGTGGQGTEPGAATAAGGHAGGVSTYTGWDHWNEVFAGGGGGGMGSAGHDAGLDAEDRIAGGTGGDGVPSDITGRTVWYGGGGGGGGGGLAFGPGGYGGFGGRGGGGEGRAFLMTFPFSLAGSEGVPGTGGGGGGGSSGGRSGIDGSLQAYRGAAGGSGVVIVRMRTTTLDSPDPRIAVRSAEPTAGGIDLGLGVFSLGEGAASADLLLVCTAAGEGAARTNALGSVSATGAVSLAATGLRPDTDYAGALVATNAAGGVAEIPLSFRTAAELHADADSGVVEGAWTLDAWAENDPSFFADNLLRASNGTTVQRAQNRRKNGNWGSANSNQNGWEGDLIDGVLNRTNGRFVAYGTNDLLVFTLSAPSAVSSMRFFAGWGSGSEWTPIAIEGIDVRAAANEPWTALANSAFQGGQTGTWGSFATFDAGGNDWLARDVRQIRVRFDRNAQRDGTMYWEIEAQGAAEADAPALHARAGVGRPLSAGGAMRTATSLSAVASAAAGAPAFADVLAVWGAVHGGEDTKAWDHARSVGSMGEAASSLAATVSGSDLDGTVYLRFCGVGADGTVSWSDSIYVPDLEVLTDVPPVVVFGSAASAGAFAEISATVVSLGSLATTPRVDVSLQYTLDPDGFAPGVSYETVPFATGAAVGAIPAVTVAPLRPNRRYYARFVAENNMHQTGTSDVFSFDTSAGASVIVSGGEWGLLQQRVTGVDNTLAKIRAVAFDEAQAQPVEGTIMAYAFTQNSTGGRATSAKTGATYAWGDNVGFLYRGVVRLEGGVKYNFAGRIDDVVDLRIDNRPILSMESYGSAAYGSWTPPATAWYDIDVRMANGGGGAGYDFGLGWSTNANASFDADHMSRFVDPGDGSFLRTGAARVLVVTGAEAVSGGVSLKATLSDGRPGAGALVAVWGASDLGTGAVSDWPNNTALLPSVTDAEQTYAGTVSLDPVATPVLRVVFVPSDAGADPVWSEPIVLDAGNPTIGPAAADPDGDRMAVAGSMLGLGTGNGFTLELLWGYTEDLAGANSTNLAVNALTGAFSGTVPIVPGTNGWWRLVARTADGGVDATLPTAFVSSGASVLKNLATATVFHHTITATGTLNELGAGTTTATVWAGSSEDDLAPVAGSSQVLSGLGPFALQAVVPGDPHTVYWKIMAVNVALGGTSWTNETPVYAIDTVDQATYTWKPEFAEGSWTNRACWTVSGIADENDCIGYPNHAKCTVLFTDGTAAAIDVPAGEFKFDHMDLNVNSLDLSFAGEGAAASTLYGNVWGAGDNSTWNGWRVVFDNLTLREENTIQLGGARSQNVTLRFQNGAVYSLSGWQESKGTNVWLEAVGGSKIQWRNGDGDYAGLTLWVADGGLLLEDSTANPPDFNYERGNGTSNLSSGAKPGDQRVLLKGASVFRIRRYGRPYSETEDSGTFGVLTITFFVPLRGWEAGASTPLYANYVRGGADNKMFAWRSEGKEVPVVLEVDPYSPLLQSGRHRTVQLLEWNAGIDLKNVTLRDRQGAHLYWTYGFPQVRTIPNSPDEIPTGVAADIVGQAGTLLILK